MQAPLPIQAVIPEKNIVVFAPHFDDVHFMLGGYILEMKEKNLLQSKNFHIITIFSRSNYIAGSGKGNFDTSPRRIKLATGLRMIEDMGCLDELLGEFNYRYELIGEKECFVRAKPFADSEMEFPHGMYEHFDHTDWQIFNRNQQLIEKWACQKDTALVFPAAIKEHIDHFITREAALKAAEALGQAANAAFYFQEDKPYAGIASCDELERLEKFISDHQLKVRVYKNHPEEVIRLAFKHYLSQVEEVYKKGIMDRSNVLKSLYRVDYGCDRLFAL